jgi:hypothetical protein
MIISCNIIRDVIPSKVRIPINFVDSGTTYLSQHRTSSPQKPLIFYSFQQQQSENLPTSGLVSGFTIARSFTDATTSNTLSSLSLHPLSQNKPEQGTTSNNKQQHMGNRFSTSPPLHTHSCAG